MSPAKTRVSLRIAMDAKLLHVDNEDSDQTSHSGFAGILRKCQKVYFLT